MFIPIFFMLTYFSFANVVIENSDVNFKEFEVAYYVEESKEMDFNEVKNQEFTLASNKKSFRSHHTHLWIKVKISNKSLKEQKLYLHHHNAYRLKYIKFYEIKNKQLLNSFDMNMSDVHDTEQMLGTDAIYKFNLEINETKTIYIQATSFIYQYCSLMLFDEKHSADYLLSSDIGIMIILSILTGIMLYHFILYLMTFFKDYLYYSLYLFFNILWGSYEYALMSKYLGWYGEKYFIFDLMLIPAPIFLAFFIKNVLQTSKFYPLENKLIHFIIIILSLNFSYLFIDIYATLYIFSIILPLVIAPLYIGIMVSLYRKKDPYIFYVIFAQGWLIFFDVFSLLFYEGYGVYNFWTRYAYILAIFVDTFAFSYLLSHRIKLLQEENKKGIHKTKRLQALSELLENISHQWRQPLTRINSSVMHIAVEMKRNKVSNPKIEKKLNDIETLSVHLSQTIDDFKSLYRQDREVSKFKLQGAIQDSLTLMGDDYQKHNIEVVVQVSSDIYLHNYLNEFKQVLQVILNNAKDALLEEQTINPNILIFAFEEEEQVVLQISNNGGEIEHAVMEKIFNPHFTTKTQGEGIGLFMSQKIIKELMNASLTCHNIAEGVCFEIRFNG